MTFELRDYQKKAVEALFDYWEGHSKPCLLELSTGSGKSLIIAQIATSAKVPVLILQPSVEILEQNKEKLIRAGYPENNIAVCSASAKGWEINEGITLATIGTIYKHADLCKHFRVVIVDEADTIPVDNVDSMYVKFLNALPSTRVVGLTATPFRNQSFKPRYEDPKTYCRPLTRIHMKYGKETRFGDWFWSGGIIFKCEIPYLQQEGYLSKTVYSMAETDWSFVRNVPGTADFDTGDMARWMDFESNVSRFHQSVTWCIKHNFKTVVFSPNIDMSMRLMNVIKSAGATCEEMDSNNDTRKSRVEKLNRLKTGETQFLVNVGMLGRGVDVPSLDAVILARPTKSLGLYVQFIGRVLRKDPDNPDKVAHILDLSGNVERFGRVEDVRMGSVQAVSKNGYHYKKDVIITKHNGKDNVWELVE